MSENDDGSHGYAVTVKDCGWSIDEEYLETTGKFSSREEFYDDDAVIRVVVDEKGRGSIKED